MKPTVLITGFLLIVFLIGFAIYYFPYQLQTEYSVRVSVKTSDKIENAISNVMSDLERRDFVPVYLEVKFYPAPKIYEICAMGIDRTKLSKRKP